MNLSNYFFRTDSIVLMSITRNLLALYFTHEIRETSDDRFMPEISLDKCLILNSTVSSHFSKSQIAESHFAKYQIA